MKQNDDIASNAFEFEMTRANDKELYQHTPCSCCSIVITSVAVVQAFMQTNMIVSHSKRKKHSLGAFKVSKNPMYLALCLSVVCAIIASAALVEDPAQDSIELINDVESLHLNNKGTNQLHVALCLSTVCAIIASAALVEDPTQGSIELINHVENLYLDNKGTTQLVDGL